MKKNNNNHNSHPRSSFQLRLFLSVLLLGIFIIMAQNNLAVAGITVPKIKTMISADYEDKILEEWIKRLSPNAYSSPVR